jgi:2-(1,2-epoxy-1,2-dihydrophenyl)acetyl-CoA isomerase
VAELASAVPRDTVLDGELVVFDGSGRPDFEAIRQRGLLGRIDGAATFIAFDHQLGLAAGIEAVDAMVEGTAVRAVVISSSKPNFSVGGDLKEFATLGDALPAHLKELTTDLHAAVSRFARMDAPVITAVRGHAAGAGMSLAISADIVIAADTAVFTLAYTRIAFTPDGSSTFFLPRLIGLRRTMELALTNRPLSAIEAHNWGLVTELVPDSAVNERAVELAATLANGPTRSFGGVKRLCLASFAENLESQMELETRTIADAARGADAREGLAAFVAKRPARFIGA